MRNQTHDQNAASPEIHAPGAQPMPRRFSLHPYQMIALPLMLLVPVLTLFGLLGDTGDKAESRNEDVVLTVEFPSRTHYETHSRVFVTAHNASSQPLTDVEVVFARDYLDNFSDFNFVPAASVIDGETYRVPLGDLPAGADRLITLDFTARAQGALEGAVSLFAGGERLASVNVATFVFP